jgi:uncharacterized protein
VRRTSLAALAILAAGILHAGPPLLPRPDRYLTDRAGVFPADRASRLNEKLASFERETSSQVLVYVDRRVPEGTTLEELGAAAMREWGVGQKKVSNGVLFLVFVDDRKMRIAVGYGLEGAIPDVTAFRIQEDVVKPLFKTGDMAAGIEAGVEAILAAARGEPYKGTGTIGADAANGFPNRIFGADPGWLFIGVFGFICAAVLIYNAVLGYRRASRGGRGSGYASSPSSAFASSGDSSWSDSSSSSSDSSSSSSDSSFSGGGGDSGGGGASDSW